MSTHRPKDIPWSVLQPNPSISKAVSSLELPSKTIASRSFADVLHGTKPASTLILQSLPKPCLKGDDVCVRIPEAAYLEGLSKCQNHLHGRVILPKGSSPIKVLELKARLSKLWALADSWNLVSLGKGYFEFSFNSAADLQKLRCSPSFNLHPGILRLFSWSKDFNIDNVQQTTTSCWVRIYGLSQEYWDERILFSVAGSIGLPICLDDTTNRAFESRIFGHYARVLIDVDLTSSLRKQILVEREGYDFLVFVEYENLPSFCMHCYTIGHHVNSCLRLSQDSHVQDSGSKSVVQEPRVMHTDRVLKNSGQKLKHYVPKKGLDSGKKLVEDHSSPHTAPEHVGCSKDAAVQALNCADVDQKIPDQIDGMEILQIDGSNQIAVQKNVRTSAIVQETDSGLAVPDRVCSIAKNSLGLINSELRTGHCSIDEDMQMAELERLQELHGGSVLQKENVAVNAVNNSVTAVKTVTDSVTVTPNLKGDMVNSVAPTVTVLATSQPHDVQFESTVKSDSEIRGQDHRMVNSSFNINEGLQVLQDNKLDQQKCDNDYPGSAVLGNIEQPARVIRMTDFSAVTMELRNKFPAQFAVDEEELTGLRVKGSSGQGDDGLGQVAQAPGQDIPTQSSMSWSKSVPDLQAISRRLQALQDHNSYKDMTNVNVNSDLSLFPATVQKEVAAIETHFSKADVKNDAHLELDKIDATATSSSSGSESCQRSQYSSLGNKSSSRQRKLRKRIGK